MDGKPNESSLLKNYYFNLGAVKVEILIFESIMLKLVKE